MVTSDHDSRHRLVRAILFIAMCFRDQKVSYNPKDINEPVVMPFEPRLEGLPLNMNRAAGTRLSFLKGEGLSMKLRPLQELLRDITNSIACARPPKR